jgi:hypothetical protein
MATNDKILIIGSSNIRNSFSGMLGKLSKSVGCTTEYIPATSLTGGYNALKHISQATIVLISFLLNGVTDAAELCNTPEEINESTTSTINEYCQAILESVKLHPKIRHYIMPPFFRSTPTWMPEKINQMGEQIREKLSCTAGIFHIPSIEFTREDLYDGVHLNNIAQTRLYQHITSFIFPSIIHTVRESIKRPSTDANPSVTSTPTKIQKPDNSTDCIMDPVTTDSLNSSEDLAAASSPSTTTTFTDPNMQTLYVLLSTQISKVSSTNENTTKRLEKLEEAIKASEKKSDIHSFCMTSMLYQSSNQAEITDLILNNNALNQVLVSGMKCTDFGWQPSIREVTDKLVGATKVHIGSIVTSVIRKFPKPRNDTLPDLCIYFNSTEGGNLFRQHANSLRKKKEGYWGSIYVSTVLTKSTQVRIAVLQALAYKLKKLPANIDKTVYVTKFESRPQLCFKLGERVERRLYYTDAVQKYSTILTDADKALARKIAGTTYGNRLEATFIVL